MRELDAKDLEAVTAGKSLDKVRVVRPPRRPATAELYHPVEVLAD